MKFATTVEMRNRFPTSYLVVIAGQAITLFLFLLGLSVAIAGKGNDKKIGGWIAFVAILLCLFLAWLDMLVSIVLVLLHQKHGSGNEK